MKKHETRKHSTAGALSSSITMMLLVATSIDGQSYSVTTVAGGSDSSHHLGDGGPATSDVFNADALAVDRQSNLYFVDSGANRVRKVAPDGIISTVAGVIPNARGFSMDTGGGFSGDGGPATSARLNHPMGIAVDAAGNLYIVDNGNQRIRKVSRDGIITTVAGSGEKVYSGMQTLKDDGPALTAKLFDPRAVAVDALGNLLIGEGNGGRIRKVTPDGVITTVAGNGWGQGLVYRFTKIYPN